MSTYVYLTRHGETVWNTKKLMQGWKDSPLTDKGVKQARQLSLRLSDVPLNAIYSSTSDRAVNTAEIIKRERPLIVIKIDNLREHYFEICVCNMIEVIERHNTAELIYIRIYKH